MILGSNQFSCGMHVLLSGLAYLARLMSEAMYHRRATTQTEPTLHATQPATKFNLPDLISAIGKIIVLLLSVGMLYQRLLIMEEDTRKITPLLTRLAVVEQRIDDHRKTTESIERKIDSLLFRLKD